MPTSASPEAEVDDGSLLRASVPGTVNWGRYTRIGIFAGLLFGGVKEAFASASKDAQVMPKMGSTTDKREQYRLMRNAMEKRFIRVANGSLLGGARLGLVTAVYFGVQNLLIESRGVHDAFNVAGASSASNAAYSLIMPGSMMYRARNVLVASAFGAAVGFPLGLLQLKLKERIANSKPSSNLTEGKQNQSRAGAAIERLEG